MGPSAGQNSCRQPLCAPANAQQRTAQQKGPVQGPAQPAWRPWRQEPQWLVPLLLPLCLVHTSPMLGVRLWLSQPPWPWPPASSDVCQGELMPPENSCPVNTEPEKPIPPPLLPSGRFFCVTCLPPSHMTRRQKSKLSSANLRDGAPLPGPRTPRSPGSAKSPYGFLSQPTTLILGRLELRHNQAAS